MPDWQLDPECEGLIRENARVEVAIILCSDENFYRDLYDRSEAL